MSIKEINKKIEKATCVLCGDEIFPLSKEIELRCDFCGLIGFAQHQCVNSHYICNSCFSMRPIEYVKMACLNYKGIDPNELAVQIMNTPTIRMHGPEHHFILPAVLATCVYNLKGRAEELAEKLEIIEVRTKCETPDHCEYNIGNCGAAHGAGVFLSILLDRTSENEDEWSLGNQLVAESIRRIAEMGGPRCCKRDTYISIQSAVEFLKNHFAIELPTSEAKCTFSLRNKSCKHEECIFYNISFSLV
ncbi:MAG: hypothetical protein GX121_03405 [Ignavibacteria bacterium]|nr:hypothetical protein [Ignavibacteria bacterium]